MEEWKDSLIFFFDARNQSPRIEEEEEEKRVLVKSEKCMKIFVGK